MTLAFIGLLLIAISTILGILGILDKTDSQTKDLSPYAVTRLWLIIIAFLASAVLFVADYYSKQRAAIEEQRTNRQLIVNLLRTLEPIESVELYYGNFIFKSTDPIIAPYVSRIAPIATAVNVALNEKNQEAYNNALPDLVCAEPRLSGDKRPTDKFKFGSLKIEDGLYTPSIERADEYPLANITTRGRLRIMVYCAAVPAAGEDIEQLLSSSDFEVVVPINRSTIDFDPSRSRLGISPVKTEGRVIRSTSRIASIRDFHGARLLLEIESLDASDPIPQWVKYQPVSLVLDVKREKLSSTVRAVHMKEIEVENSDRKIISGRWMIDGVKDNEPDLYPCLNPSGKVSTEG